MDKHDLFEQYGIGEERFSKLGVTWDELSKIHGEYSEQLPDYLAAAKSLADCLHSNKSIHSIKYRVKDPEHLVEKIIRKMAQDPGSSVTYANYRTEIRDLVGVRALHLFKEDWLVIHNFLAGCWEFCTPPKANYKAGDPDEILELYSRLGCELYEHPHGYRSVHYNLSIRPARDAGRDVGRDAGHDVMVAEVQVRTLFEEAWSEIDHYFRYSSKRESDQAEQCLGVLNNITSNADALASYLNRMENHERGGDGAPGETRRMNVRDIYKKVRYE
jgi:ppGpp synthetase/RelA/SpoT-type nucleotidyltranferase